ncbi:tRNA (guanine(10)-N(2))-dimethyltransferase [Methanothermobacter tenebrarum]|uniref:tRNA (guanine(26)-N(2))-dimethyltransferase n=1 Tax=Methanothermobacter tenebrarum TaxID=680118 RepID=A0A328PA44_9EURY|nr:tRNA (guanine(10)-N(2))-dimethyltransferase [Methanothermobacter tenebrarum]MBC7101389.1 tRNA (guanine(26)-N(2))-dimethyltransferase [Methanobacteriales archaeon]NPV65200.1 tRNA (guanine(26)-N(2))-dimethyltransferase [Methanobacteriaceae archaeon]RAO79568.1 tRNA (guanine(10)-N(2))-dimethyltransferase [Methanothermobacter tenebrarum]
MMTINEGIVTVKIPSFHKISSKAPVFYNPNMELNRDISVLAIQQFQKEKKSKIKIADLFAGSGIRGIRYRLEIEGVESVLANDINPVAVEFIEENSKLNNAPVDITMEDANILLRRNRGIFDVVDIDPFGTPSPFIESAGYSLKKDSLLCVTATDTSSLCGTYKNPCIRKYNAVPLKTEYCHENGLRILVGFTSLTLAKYKKYIKSRLAYSSQHYMRIYLEIGKGAAKADKSLKENIGFIYHCHNCLYRNLEHGMLPILPKKCPKCGGRLDFSGPLWIGELEDESFIKGMIRSLPEKTLNKKKEALKLLKLLEEEAGMPPTFYDIHKICSKMRISAPPLKKVMENLQEKGFKVVRSHCRATGIKTNASIMELKKSIKEVYS